MAMLAGAALLIAHVVFAARFGVGVVVAFALVVALLTALVPQLAFAVLIEALLFQNAIIAAALPEGSGTDVLVLLQATSSAASIAVACVALPAIVLRRARLEAGTMRVLGAGLCFALVVVAYTAYGAVVADMVSASAYARIYLIGPMLLVCGMFFRHQLSSRFCSDALCLAGWVLIAWGAAEVLAPYTLYDLFDVPRFMNLKFAAQPGGEYFASVASAIETFTRPFLNLSGKFGLDLKLLRLNGPNLHPISYAYGVVGCALVAVLARRRLLTALAVCLTVLIGAKGPLFELVVSLALTGLYQMTRSPRLLSIVLGAVLVLYSGGGLAYGVASGDYHVIGLFRGLSGFLQNPLGHGIGVGGNLSALAQSTSAWLNFEHNGGSFALESAVGVVLYQLGLAGVALVALLATTFRLLWRRALSSDEASPAVILPIALAALAVNGVFQEEALSPAGWGLLLFVAALASPGTRRQTEQKEQTPDTPR
jgi:hypothetical protein